MMNFKTNSRAYAPGIAASAFSVCAIAAAKSASMPQLPRNRRQAGSSVRVSQAKLSNRSLTMPNIKKFAAIMDRIDHRTCSAADKLMKAAAMCTVYRLKNPSRVKVGNTVSIQTTICFYFTVKDKPPLLLVFDEKRKPYLLPVQSRHQAVS